MSGLRRLFRGARLLDPESGRDTIGDVIVVGDRIAAIGHDIHAEGLGADVEIIDCAGFCLAPGLVDMRVQLRELRYVVVPTHADPEENFQAVGRLAETSGWHVTANDPGRCLEARTPGSMLSEGEIVAVRFRQHDVLVASICDPGVGFSLVGRRRCTQNREAVRLAVSAGKSAAA